MTRSAADMWGCGFVCTFLAESRGGKDSSSSPAAEADVLSASLCTLHNYRLLLSLYSAPTVGNTRLFEEILFI